MVDGLLECCIEDIFWSHIEVRQADAVIMTPREQRQTGLGCAQRPAGDLPAGRALAEGFVEHDRIAESECLHQATLHPIVPILHWLESRNEPSDALVQRSFD